MDITLKNISIELPAADISFIETLVRKMGWTLKSQENVDSLTENTSVSHNTGVHKQYSSRIMHLRSLRGNGITPQDMESDERLAYLLNR